MARLADRYSLLFLAVTVAIAAAAWWFTGDPIRAVAVLVVATPCPLILAVPVALVAGLSRAAHFGVLIKGAKPLEALARIRTLILDKTGTLTDGRPQIVSIDRHGDMAEDEVLYFAAALDQASKHPIAQAIVAAARGAGHRACRSRERWPRSREKASSEASRAARSSSAAHGFVASAGWATGEATIRPGRRVRSLVAVAVDGRLAGHLVMADALRSGTSELACRAASAQGIGRILLATGDRRAVAERVTEGLGLDGAPGRSDPRPEGASGPDRAQERPGDDGGRRRERRAGARGSRHRRGHGRAGRGGLGRGGRCRAAGRPVDRLAAGDRVARRSRRIALESVVAGIGLSVPAWSPPPSAT